MDPAPAAFMRASAPTQGAQTAMLAAMNTAIPFGPLGTTFNRFLYAPIDDDPAGSQLSVLSALAREGLDAWEYAARLQRLPTQTQVGELSALIAALPAGAATRQPPGVIAIRLVALLPPPTLAERLRIADAAETAAAPGGNIGGHLTGLQILICGMCFILLSLWIIGDFSEGGAAVTPAVAATSDQANIPETRTIN
jgi:hypothetical protein